MLVARWAGCLGDGWFKAATADRLAEAVKAHPSLPSRGAAFGVTLSDIAEDDDRQVEALAATTIYVCITCWRAGDAADLPPPGLALARATANAAAGTGVAVKRVRCLANCSRGLSAAMRCDGSWTYVFGGLEPADAQSLVEGAQLLARAADGLLPWRGRPEILKRGLIARVPPIDFSEESE